MDLEKTFKNLIKLEFLLVIVTLFYTFTHDHIVVVANESWTLLDTVISIFGLGYYYNLYFLYKFKSIGKTLYVPIIFIVTVLGYNAPIYIIPENFDFLIWQAQGLLQGMIIMLLYFSEIKDKFSQV